MKKVLHFFDRLEDKIRAHLSHYPILYAIVGAVGIVLVWKGIWETTELLPILYGPGSIVLGILILLATGLLVSFFIGDSIIISGFKREKKIVEKTEKEVLAERAAQESILAKIDHIEDDLHALKAHEGERTIPQ